jgi:hypothetical protein
MTDYMKEISEFEFVVDEHGEFIGPEGNSHETKAEAMYYGQLGGCGCGSPQCVHKFIIDILSKQNPKTKMLDYELITSHIEDNHDEAYQFIMHMLGEKHLVEHGGSVYGSWLTPRGEQFVEIGPVEEE